MYLTFSISSFVSAGGLTASADTGKFWSGPTGSCPFSGPWLMTLPSFASDLAFSFFMSVMTGLSSISISTFGNFVLVVEVDVDDELFGGLSLIFFFLPFFLTVGREQVTERIYLSSFSYQIFIANYD